MSLKKNLSDFYWRTRGNLSSKAFILPSVRGVSYIFNFHDVSTKNSLHHFEAFSTEIELFKSNIEWIKKNFSIVSLPDFISKTANNNSENIASITFDDGFYSVKTTALPILKQHNIPFAVFFNETAIKENWLWISNIKIALKLNRKSYLERIYENYINKNLFDFDTFVIHAPKYIKTFTLSGKLGDDYSDFKEQEISSLEKIYCDENDVRELKNEGVIIGSHTSNHKYLKLCSVHDIKQEIKMNKEYLELLIDQPVEHISIPFGDPGSYNEIVIDTAKKSHNWIHLNQKYRVTSEFLKVNLLPRKLISNEIASGIFVDFRLGKKRLTK